MNDDLELEHWQSLWQVNVVVPSDLREMAKKHLKRMRMMLLADIGVTVVIGGALILWALAGGESSVRFLAIWVWTMILAAWIFRWFNSGGNWTGAAPNTEVFLEKLRRSHRASLRNLKFGWVLGVIQLVFNCVWAYREVTAGVPLSIWQFMTLKISLVVWACVACLFGWTIWLFLKLKEQLASVERLQADWNCPEKELENISGPWQRQAWSFIARLLQDLAMFPARFDGLDWTLRRKKKKSW